MKLNILIIGLVFFIFKSVNAQEPVLLVQGTASNNYLIHKVEPKENWFSIGRLYNVHPKELALYNKAVVEKGLQIAQVINIPLNTQNKVDIFGTLEEGEATVPLFYIVKKEEGLYRVSVNNNTTMQTIREWNNLINDTVTLGSKLKVGMLKVKYAESAFVNKNLSAIPVYAATTTVVDSAAKSNEIVKTEGPVVVNKKPKEDDITQVTKLNKTEKPKQSEIDGAIATKVENKPKQVAIDESIVQSKPKQTAIDEPLKLNEVKTTEVKPIELNSEGYFKNTYNFKSTNTLFKEGKCNIFKTSKGWDDEKFYAIMNDVPLGAIVKIENKLTGKVIYAKVLDGLRDFNQSKEVVCSLSNAAAYALGVKEGVFDIVTSY